MEGRAQLPTSTVAQKGPAWLTPSHCLPLVPGVTRERCRRPQGEPHHPTSNQTSGHWLPRRGGPSAGDRSWSEREPLTGHMGKGLSGRKAGATDRGRPQEEKSWRNGTQKPSSQAVGLRQAGLGWEGRGRGRGRAGGSCTVFWALYIRLRYS